MTSLCCSVVYKGSGWEGVPSSAKCRCISRPWGRVFDNFLEHSTFGFKQQYTGSFWDWMHLRLDRIK
jgi:hypothetical protein